MVARALGARACADAGVQNKTEKLKVRIIALSVARHLVNHSFSTSHDGGGDDDDDDE